MSRRIASVIAEYSIALAFVYAVSIAASLLWPYNSLANVLDTYQYHDDATGESVPVFVGDNRWGDGVTLDYRTLSFGLASAHITEARYHGMILYPGDDARTILVSLLTPRLPDWAIRPLPSLPPRTELGGGDFTGRWRMAEFGGWPLAAVTAEAALEINAQRDTDGNVKTSLSVRDVSGGLLVPSAPRKLRDVRLIPLRPIVLGLLFDAGLVVAGFELARAGRRRLVGLLRRAQGKCPRCGHITTPGSIRCTECGTSLSVSGRSEN